MKTCSQCHTQLPLDCFDNQSTGKLGRRADCKVCRKRFTQSKQGLIKASYAQQKAKSKKRGYGAPTYSEADLYTWAMGQPEFHLLFDAWVQSGFQSNFKPSIDRLDDYVSYTLGNIQVINWYENNHKGTADQVSGKNNKKNLAVDMLDMSGNFMQRFHSVSEAARHFNGVSSNIIGAINLRTSKGKTATGGCRTYTTQTAYGHKWRYSATPHTNLEKLI